MAGVKELGPRPEISKSVRDQEWERKQRNREYRVAARREKRNRKADEKKQRKLNATILRRMTRNPDKYNKNAERNRLRDIEGERRRIWQEAIRQAQRLAAIHDPSGASFNVGPVVVQDDGTVISQETLHRREERFKEKAAAQIAKETTYSGGVFAAPTSIKTETPHSGPPTISDGFNPDRLALVEATKSQQLPSRLSKTQQKKRAALEPRPPPIKPAMPENISVPEGEENWLDLWDLTDDQLERRVLREKKRKAAERKALRVKQQSGKAERRIARDEKRKVYRDIKLTWKTIKEEQVRERTKLKSMEDEESKKIAVDINVMERKAALDHCIEFGFTLANTPGVDEIKPRALGMKGVEVDFDAIEIGERRSDVKPKQNVKRVNLGDVPEEAKAEYVPTGQGDEDENGDVEEFIQLDVGEGQDFETLNYNHKLRRKLRRAIDNAEIRKEMLVRQRAIDYYRGKDIEVPPVLTTPYKPINVKGQRILDNGRFETAKQERVRARLELAEFNTQMRVLRKQAKDAAIYAGLRKHAELMGRIAASDTSVKQEYSDGNSQTGHADMLSALKASLTAVPSLYANKSTKRSQTVSDDSSSGDSDEPSETDVVASSLSDTSSDISSSLSGNGDRARKRQKVQTSTSKKQSESTNSDRQAMIDAESARTETCNQSNKKILNSSGSWKEVDANANYTFGRSGLGKGANSTSTLNGDTARKIKFHRLLGGEKLTEKANDEELENPGGLPDHSARINASLEKQYENGIAYKKETRHKGLGW